MNKLDRDYVIDLCALALGIPLTACLLSLLWLMCK